MLKSGGSHYSPAGKGDEITEWRQRMSRSPTSSVLFSLPSAHTHVKCSPFSFNSPKQLQPRAEQTFKVGVGVDSDNKQGLCYST